jgi:hypothetical protein
MIPSAYDSIILLEIRMSFARPLQELKKDTAPFERAVSFSIFKSLLKVLEMGAWGKNFF